MVSVLAYVVYGFDMLVQAFLDFSGCALVSTYVKKWCCGRIAVKLGFSIRVASELLFECAFMVSVLAYVVYGFDMLVQAFVDFSGCALVSTYVKTWCCGQIALKLGFSI
jgi:hypothetical protein